MKNKGYLLNESVGRELPSPWGGVSELEPSIPRPWITGLFNSWQVRRTPVACPMSHPTFLLWALAIAGSKYRVLAWPA